MQTALPQLRSSSRLGQSNSPLQCNKRSKQITLSVPLINESPQGNCSTGQILSNKQIGRYYSY